MAITFSPPPPHFTPGQKVQFQSDANTLNDLANVLSDLGAATDPLHPAVKLVGNLASQLAAAIDSQVGTVNSVIQTAVSTAASALAESPGLNPIGITLSTASAIDKLAAKLLQLLANDPPDGNFTSVYQAPDWNFGNITGAGATANTFLTDSWKLLQDAANALVGSERYQGAEFAGDTASQALQNTAFNNALSAYDAHRKTVSTDLNAYLTELQTSVSDINLSSDSSLANLQAYLKGLANPLTDDPFLKGFISSIDATAPNLTAAIGGDVQQALTALEGMQAPALTGSAFASLSAIANQLGGTTAPITASQIQAEDFAITRTTLPLDQATSIANSINSGAQTEVHFINNLLSQVADTTIPAVAVEGSMYGAVGTSAEVTLLATQFLPVQVANAILNNFNPVVYASEALGLVFAFGNENGGMAFASNFGPANAAMPATAAGDTAFAAAAASAIFGSAATANTPGAILGFVSNWEAFYTSHGIPGIPNATAAQIDLAARGAAWGDAVGIALVNKLGLLNGQAINFLEDAAQGIAVYSASLASQPSPAPFQGAATGSGAGAANAVQLTGVATPSDHIWDIAPILHVMAGLM